MIRRWLLLVLIVGCGRPAIRYCRDVVEVGACTGKGSGYRPACAVRFKDGTRDTVDVIPMLGDRLCKDVYNQWKIR